MSFNGGKNYFENVGKIVNSTTRGRWVGNSIKVDESSLNDPHASVGNWRPPSSVPRGMAIIAHTGMGSNVAPEHGDRNVLKRVSEHDMSNFAARTRGLLKAYDINPQKLGDFTEMLGYQALGRTMLGETLNWSDSFGISLQICLAGLSYKYGGQILFKTWLISFLSLSFFGYFIDIVI
jgi:hypothetical protein